jgi:hypothetical protein
MVLRQVLSACVQSASITKLSGLRSNPWNLGAVAQLGERLICIQEAAGSIPTSSTMLSGSGSERSGQRRHAEVVSAADMGL